MSPSTAMEGTLSRCTYVTTSSGGATPVVSTIVVCAEAAPADRNSAAPAIVARGNFLMISLQWFAWSYPTASAAVGSGSTQSRRNSRERAEVAQCPLWGEIGIFVRHL